MASRIIKPNGSTANRIHNYAFDEQAGAGPRLCEAAQPLWDDGQRSETPKPEPVPGNPKAPSELETPAADLAQIEKLAFESGFHQGEKAGLEMAEKKMEAVMRRYAETVLEVGRLKHALYAQVEGEVVKLALEVAKKIVHREIQADQEIIQTLVRVALGHVAERSAVTVRLNPVDCTFVAEHRAELCSDSDGREIVLVADKAIDRGGCLVQTECGDIDARIEEEFREVERAFFQGTR